MRRREKPMKQQNRVNEDKDRNTQRQERVVATGREKVGEGKIATKPKPVEEKDTHKKGRET